MVEVPLKFSLTWTTKPMEHLRKEFLKANGHGLSLPIAGTAAWAIAGVASLWLTPKTAALVLFVASGTIFPMALGVSRLLGENPVARTVFGGLMGRSVIMVNLLWAVHIPLYLLQPDLVPLSLGIGLGLHWIVYGWILQHPVGMAHAVTRTIGVFAAWFLFPDQTLTAVAAVIVVVYLGTLTWLAATPANTQD